MNWNLYLRNGKLFVPTTGVADGFYREMEPVSAVSVANREAVREALQSTIARGNPPAPFYQAGTKPQPVVLKYAGLKSWSQFTHSSLSWSIKKNDRVYEIVADRINPKGYWEEDSNQRIEFPLGTAVDEVIERMIVILQEAAKQQ